MSCESYIYAMAHNPPLVKAALSATGVLAVAGITLLGFGPLAASSLLHPHFQWDVWWMIFYGGWACTIAGLVWVRRGTLLLLLTGLCLLTLLLVPVVCADIGLAFGGLIWIGVLAASAGNRLLRWLIPGLVFSPAEQCVFATILGYGGLSFLTLGIALLQILARPYLVGALVGITLLLWRDFLMLGQQWWTTQLPTLRSVWQTHDLRLPAGIFAAGTVCFFGAFVWAIAPSLHHDALSYHLAVPQIYANHGGLITVHEEFRAYWIHNAEMLYTFGLVLIGQPLPSLLHCSCGLLLTGLVFTFGRRIGGSRLGLLAAGMLYAIPVITWESGSAYIDLVVSMYTFGAVHAVTLCWLERNTRWLTLAGLLSGLAIGTKLNAALILLPIGAFTLFLVWTLATDWRERGKALVRVGLPAVLISAPWFGLEWIRTGSPIFPFYNNYFKSPLWPPENPSFEENVYAIRKIFEQFHLQSDEQRVHFYTDTDELTAQYNRLGICLFSTLPIPHTSPPLAWHLSHQPVRAIYMGDARREKGYHLLPHLVQDLWVDYVEKKKLVFTFQSNYNIISGESEAIVARAQLENFPPDRVRLIKETLSSEGYRDLLLSGDINLLLYEADNYYARSSGILTESLAAGIPVVVPAGTWLARQFLSEVYQYWEHVGETIPVVKPLGRDSIRWEQQGESGVNPLRDTELLLTGNAKVFCWLRVPPSATHLLVSFCFAHGDHDASVYIDQLNDREQSLQGSSLLVEGVGPERQARLLVLLTARVSRIWFGIGNLHSHSITSVTHMQIRFLAQPVEDDIPLGTIGLIYHSAGEIPALLREMIDHYPHYRQTAYRFAQRWHERHNADRLVATLQHVERPPKTQTEQLPIRHAAL